MSQTVPTSVGVVDVGIANLGSMIRVMSELVQRVVPLTDPAQMKEVDRLVLPGVGAFPVAMERLRDGGFDVALLEAVLEDRKPILGVCLGMQLLACRGEEYEETEGLGLIRGRVRRLEPRDNLRVPHMGWNTLSIQRPSKILNKVSDQHDLYFVHSYVLELSDPTDLVAFSSHGEDFCSVIEARNVVGVQFHPEKSSRVGRRVLLNFCEMDSC